MALPEIGYTIRLAQAGELEELGEIERAAAGLFAEIGLHQVAESDPLPLEFLQAQQRVGLVWVAVGAEDELVGFAVASGLEEAVYLEEISVTPAHGRRGIGKELIRAVCDWATGNGSATITLLTFQDVPWNAPFYSRQEFRVLKESEMNFGLKCLLEEETKFWFPHKRVCMTRELRQSN